MLSVVVKLTVVAPIWRGTPFIVGHSENTQADGLLGEQEGWFMTTSVKQASKLPQELSSTPPISDADEGLQMVDLSAAILSTIAYRIAVDGVTPNWDVILDQST